MEASEKEWLDSQIDFRIILPDGTIKHLHSVAHPVRDDSGEIAEVVGTVMDVTEQWKARVELEEAFDRALLKVPVLGEVWLKYQVAQFSRVLSTLLIGGIPLMQALDTSADSLGTQVLKKVLLQAVKLVREGQSLSQSLRVTKIFPGLSIDMIEVGESTGALPAMLGSVAEFYEEDVSTRTTAALSLIEPVIMIFMGIFVGFVLISLYLPIFSLADSIRT